MAAGRDESKKIRQQKLTQYDAAGNVSLKINICGFSGVGSLEFGQVCFGQFDSKILKTYTPVLEFFIIWSKIVRLHTKRSFSCILFGLKFILTQVLFLNM
jgi:hypothetical protein